MFLLIKQGIQRIKDTKQYAREKNVMSWFHELILGIFFTFILAEIMTLYGILFISPLLKNFNPLFTYISPTLAIIITFLIMIQYGQYPIKLMILKTFYIQKATILLLNKMDMYMWRKTGKDSLATQFVMKYKIPVQLIFYLPLFIIYLF